MADAFGISAQVRPEDIRRLRRVMTNVQSQLPRAMATAVTRTVRAVRVQFVNAVFRDLNVQKRHLWESGNKRRPIQDSLTREGGHVTGGFIRAGYGRREGDVGAFSDGRSTGGRIPLSRFQAKQTRQGVQYRIRRGGPREVIPDAFTATFQSGHHAVVRRKGRERYPLLELFGPSVGRVAANRPEIEALRRGGAQVILNRNMEQQVRRFVIRAQRNA